MRVLTPEERASVPDWMKGQPVKVVEPMFHLPWNGARTSDQAMRALSCGVCYTIPKVGDTIRWVLCDGVPNTWVCKQHDGPYAAERFKRHYEVYIRPVLDKYCHC